MTDSKIVELSIKAKLNGFRLQQEKREYFSMSSIGFECARKLYYDWHWASDLLYSAKSARIFQRGDLEESRIINQMESVGLSIVDRQLELVEPRSYGHIKGHIDGRLSQKALDVLGLSEGVLLECKSAMQKYYLPLVKKGIATAFNNYYKQANTYAHYTKDPNILFIVTNKNTEDQHYEVKPYDGRHVEFSIDRALDIIHSEQAPPRRWNEDYFECNWCPHLAVCYQGAQPVKSCRTCKYSEPDSEGTWYCNTHKQNLSYQVQLKGCSDWTRKQGL